MFGHSFFGASWFGPQWFGPSNPVQDELGGTTEEWENRTKFGKIQQGEIVTPEVPDNSILSEVVETPDIKEVQYVQGVTESQETYETHLQEKLDGEEEIGLIMAIVEAHFN